MCVFHLPILHSYSEVYVWVQGTIYFRMNHSFAALTLVTIDMVKAALVAVTAVVGGTGDGVGGCTSGGENW